MADARETVDRGNGIASMQRDGNADRRERATRGGRRFDLATASTGHGERAVRGGRRPGRNDTKNVILEAARYLFASAGYNETSIRAIAGRAGVDPALVMHYFSSKEGLLRAAMEWPLDIDQAARDIFEGDHERTGERLIRMLCEIWEDETTRHPYAVILRNAVQHEEAARLTAEFVRQVIVGQLVSRTGDPSAPLRGLLAHSALVGLVTVRYVVGVEPLASAPVEQVVQALGPTLQRYLMGDIGAAKTSISDGRSPTDDL